MYNNCRCNREFGLSDGCRYNRSEWNSGCGCNNNYCNDSAALYEVECVARAALHRGNRENRCAREFVRRMKNACCGY